MVAVVLFDKFLTSHASLKPPIPEDLIHPSVYIHLFLAAHPSILMRPSLAQYLATHPFT
jgi:hypothetical protein